MRTFVPSGTDRLITPAAGEGTSTLALSVSNSHSGSSVFTNSPSFLCHLISTASLTDSPRPGTCTFVGIDGEFYEPDAEGGRDARNSKSEIGNKREAPKKKNPKHAGLGFLISDLF